MLNNIEDGGYDEALLVVYDYSQGQAGEIDTVLHLSITELDGDGDYPAVHYDEARESEEEFDWNMLSSSLEEVEDTGAVLSPVVREQVTQVDYDYDKSTEISQNIIVGLEEDWFNMENDNIVRDYEDNYDRIEEALQVTMDNVYDQAMIFHIILLLGKLEQNLVSSLQYSLFCRNLSDLSGGFLRSGSSGCNNSLQKTRGRQ